jgi:hypothetical protein
LPTGFIWRGLSEAEAEAQRATYLQAVRDNQFTAQQITRLFANPVMPLSAANATGIAKYAATIGPTVTPPPTTIAAVAIGLSFAQSQTSLTGSAFTDRLSSVKSINSLFIVCLNLVGLTGFEPAT